MSGVVGLWVCVCVWGGGGGGQEMEDSEEPQERLLKESREKDILLIIGVIIVSTVLSKDKFVSRENTVFCILAESN